MLVDSSAWLEYLIGTKKGEILRDLVEGNAQLFTSPVILAEIYSKSARTDGHQKAKERIDFIARRCIVIAIDDALGMSAGKLHAEQRSRAKDFGMIDAFILASAMRKGTKVITCDAHFKGIENATVL